MKRLPPLGLIFAIASATCLAGPPAATGPASGPLRVHPWNPRYFTDGSGKAIYLGGHQVFTEIQDNAWTKPWVLDWLRHLEFMKERKLNYLRNWIIFSTGGGSKNVAKWNRTRTYAPFVCHCFAEAVSAAEQRHCLPDGKQWHTFSQPKFLCGST